MVDMTEDEKTRWQQGCRAVFAGFVAAAPARGVTANIDTFWQTEQKDIILPSLQSLVDDASNDPKRALFDLLNSAQNVTTRMIRSETDDIDAWDQVTWDLTKEGKKTFPCGVHVAPTPEPNPMPKLGSRRGSWWDE